MRVAMARVVARARRRREREIGGHLEQPAARTVGAATRPRPSTSSVPSVPATTDTPTTPGVHDAAVCWSTTSTPSRVVMRTANESSAPSRRATVGSVALTDAISPSHVRTWSTMCEPDAPSQPPPRAASNHHSGTRASGSATSGTYCTSVARRGSPIRPSAIARAATARSGAHRNSWPTSAVTPARVGRRAASPRPRVASSANGFSQITCRPASHASIASDCVRGGRRRDRDRVDTRRARARPRATCMRAGYRAARRGARCDPRRGRRARSRRTRRRAARERARAHRSRCRRLLRPARASSPRRGRRPRAAARRERTGRGCRRRCRCAALLQVGLVPRDVREQPHLRVRRTANGPRASGSGSTVSSVAIATRSSSSATRSASWSTSAPRAMFTRCTPGFTCCEQRRRRPGDASSRSPAPRARGDRRRRRASSRSRTISTPSIGLGASVRRMRLHVHVERRARAGRSPLPIPPSPTSAIVLPATASSARPGKVPVLGRLVQPRLRHALGPREHRGHHPLGDRLRARAACARDDPAVVDRAAAPCRRRCRTPAPTARRRRRPSARCRPSRSSRRRTRRPRAPRGGSPPANSTISTSGAARRRCARRRPAPIWLITRSPTTGDPRARRGRLSPMKSEVVVDRHPVLRRPGVVRRRHASSSRASPPARCTGCGPSRTAPRCARTTHGGANGAALAADGSILVTQNGGMDFSHLPGARSASCPSRDRPRPACSSRRPDGSGRRISPTPACTRRTTSRSPRTATCTSPTPATTRRPRASSSAG